MTKSGKTTIEIKREKTETAERQTATTNNKSGKRIDCFIDCHTLKGSQ
jgi:hypothetical protein